MAKEDYLNWAPKDDEDNTTKMFPLQPKPQATSKPARKTRRRKKRRLRIVGMYQRLPQKTKRLLLLALAILLVLVVLLVVLAFVKPKEKVVSKASATPSASTKVDLSATANPDGSAIGSLVVKSGVINVRTEPNTDAPILGIIQEGDKADVFRISDQKDYTWYQIGEEKWIADVDHTLTYTKG